MNRIKDLSAIICVLFCAYVLETNLLHAQTGEESISPQRFLSAIYFNDQTTVQEYLDQGGDVNVTYNDGSASLKKLIMTAFVGRHYFNLAPYHNIDGMRALMIASQWASPRITNLLLDRGADVDATTEDGTTALMIATRRGNIGVMEALLDRGADVDATTEDGTTPLMIATRRGDIGTMEVLIYRGADVDATTEDETTLVATAIDNYYPSNRVDALNTLLDGGANVNATTEDGTTPLMLATRRGDIETMGILIDRGADVDATTEDGTTPLAIAIFSNKRYSSHSFSSNERIFLPWDVVVDLLIEEGADRNLIDLIELDHYERSRFMNASLNWAIRAGRIDFVEELFDEGGVSDINLHLAFRESVKWNRVDIIEALIARGAGVNRRFHNAHNGDYTFLMFAAREGHVGAINTLVDRGADVRATTGDGTTALMIAAQEGHVDAINTLVDRGSDVNATTENGVTALMFAAQEGHVDALNTLVDRRSDVNATTENGATALMFAAFREDEGDVDAINTLLDRGADVNAATEGRGWPWPYFMHRRGQTALSLARTSGNTDVENVLRARGATF